jgi:hypothetical protein
MRPVPRADNLTTFMCRLYRNLGTSTSWNPQGLSRPVMGLLYLCMYGNRNYFAVCTSSSPTFERGICFLMHSTFLRQIENRCIYPVLFPLLLCFLCLLVSLPCYKLISFYNLTSLTPSVSSRLMIRLLFLSCVYHPRYFLLSVLLLWEMTGYLRHSVLMEET